MFELCTIENKAVLNMININFQSKEFDILISYLKGKKNWLPWYYQSPDPSLKKQIFRS